MIRPSDMSANAVAAFARSMPDAVKSAGCAIYPSNMNLLRALWAYRGPVTDPGTRTMHATSVRQEWRDVVERVYQGDHRVIVERSGMPVAAIVSVADPNRLLEIAACLPSPAVGEHTTNAG